MNKMTNRKIDALSNNHSLKQLSLNQLSSVCAGQVTVTIRDNGWIDIIDSTDTQAMGLKEGDKFEIKLEK